MTSVTSRSFASLPGPCVRVGRLLSPIGTSDVKANGRGEAESRPRAQLGDLVRKLDARKPPTPGRRLQSVHPKARRRAIATFVTVGECGCGEYARCETD